MTRVGASRSIVGRAWQPTVAALRRAAGKAVTTPRTSTATSSSTPGTASSQSFPRSICPATPMLLLPPTRNSTATAWLPLFAGTDVGFSSLCVSKEVVYQFVDEVIRELAAVSPSPYIHIGGDEALSTTLVDYVT